MIDPGLGDKVVLITGGNNPHGIGAATAKAFAACGAAVFIQYFRQTGEAPAESSGDTDPDTPGLAFFYAMQAKSADGVVGAIREHGGRAAAYEADLAEPGVVTHLFDRAEKEIGPVDGLPVEAVLDIRLTRGHLEDETEADPQHQVSHHARHVQEPGQTDTDGGGAEQGGDQQRDFRRLRPFRGRLGPMARAETRTSGRLESDARIQIAVGSPAP